MPCSWMFLGRLSDSSESWQKIAAALLNRDPVQAAGVAPPCSMWLGFLGFSRFRIWLFRCIFYFWICTTTCLADSEFGFLVWCASQRILLHNNITFLFQFMELTTRFVLLCLWFICLQKPMKRIPGQVLINLVLLVSDSPWR